MPEKINFTMDLKKYGDVFEASVPWKHGEGYYLCIDNSNTFTANQLIASVKNKKLRLRKINPNAAKNENSEPTKFDGGIDCKIILNAEWGICDVGTVKFNENGESIGLDGKVTMTVYESYLKNVAKGEIVAFFANPKWVFVDTSNREVIGEILQGKTAFGGSWPAPKVFCNKLVAKKFNGDAVKGKIKFYDKKLYVGDIEFSENGQGIQALPPEKKLDPEVLKAVNFKEAFLSESSKSKNSEWNALTGVSAICGKILQKSDFTTRLKNHLNLSKKVLNREGLIYLKNTMGIALPGGYETEAACLVYLNFLNNNKSDTNENDDPNNVSFMRMENNVWRAFDNGGNQYTIRIKGKDRDVAASDYVIYEMIQDKLMKVYKISNEGALSDPGDSSHKFNFRETESNCGLTIEINDEGEVTKSTCTSDNDDAGYKAFYDKAKLVLGEEEFRKQIMDNYGSMSSIAKLDKIAEILKGKDLDPGSYEYKKFAKAIEEYIKEGKNGTQKEKSTQPGGESKSSPSGASAQSSNQGEIIFKENNGMFLDSNDGTKQISVKYLGIDSTMNGCDIDYTMLYKMVTDKDKIIKLYDNSGKTTSGVCKIEGKDGKPLGTITFNNGDVSSHTLNNPTEDGKGKFYDSVKKLLGDNFKDKLVVYNGNLHYMAKNMKIISDILKNAGEDPNSHNYGEFANAIEKYIEDEDKKTLEDAKNEALKDLYTRLGQQLPNGMTIEKFEPENFVKLLGLKPKVRTKVENKLEALGKLKDSKEKQIDLLTRLLMRMKRKKDFEKNHKFGKIRYALGEREKTDPKIKKCFEAAGKYIVKNYDKFGQIVNEGDVKKECSNLKNIFVDLHVGEPWADNLDGKLKIEIVRKCWTSSNYQGPFKAMMGIIFASMAGIEKSEDIICACDALKKGGIKSSEKGTFLGDATQIRKSIKALCGRDNVKPAARKVVIKKLLVNDYQFIDKSHCNELFPPEPKSESEPKTSK